MFIFDVCYIFVTSDRAPGNCRFIATIACENIRFLSLAAKSEEKRMFSQAAATNAVLVNILAEVKERQITATACNLKRTTRFFLKSGVRTTMCDNVGTKCYQESTKCEGTGSAKLLKHIY